jgi:hypothetical protein
MCRFSMPPGYVWQRPAAKPKLGPLIPVIEAILEADRTAPVKQRHTAKRIFERLRDEDGFAGGYTVVKDHVRIEQARGREIFVPLAHPLGHARADFGMATSSTRSDTCSDGQRAPAKPINNGARPRQPRAVRLRVATSWHSITNDKAAASCTGRPCGPRIVRDIWSKIRRA